MIFCPNCGTQILHQGAFCQECGYRLPALRQECPTVYERSMSLKNEPEKPVSGLGGFDLAHTVACSVNDTPELFERSFSTKGVANLPCDFSSDDFDCLSACIEGIYCFIENQKSLYGSEKYTVYLDEIENDVAKYNRIFEICNESLSYPDPVCPFLTKCRKFYVELIALLKKEQAQQGKNEAVINQFELFVRTIDVIAEGNYNHDYFWRDYRSDQNLNQIQHEPLEGVQQPQVSDSNSLGATDDQSNGDAQDFREQIEALEDDLSGHKPAFNINEYNPEMDYEAELANLIGLNSLKSQLNRFIDNFRLQLIRQKEHPELKMDTSFNCIFKGKPGTGKTTVARLVAGLLRQKGILKGGRSVEVDASSLVSGWIGFSAKVTNLAALKAIDGVLFIDEAYAIMNNFEGGKGPGPGKEVIDTLTPIMENNRDRLLVIMAGYDEEMDKFLKASNTGFPSRFKSVMQFEDYNADEMTEIFKQMVKSNFYEIGEDELRRIHYLFEHIYDAIPSLPTFANARTVRNVFDQVRQRASQRMLNDLDCDHDRLEIDDVTLTAEEIDAALGKF